jgi:hypothetical protein
LIHLEEVSGPREYADYQISHLVMPEIPAVIMMKKEATNPEADLLPEIRCKFRYQFNLKDT